MLLKDATLEAIAAGDIDVVFRRWKRPTVKSGGTLKTRAGLLAIDAVEPVALSSLRAADARRAGYASLAELRRQLERREGQVYRVAVRLAGPDPRIALRRRRVAGKKEAAEIAGRLGRLDRASRTGPWTERTLRLIAARPGVRAADLAESQGLTKKVFKPRVRKLKELGLTESLEVGYRLSPRGESLLEHL